MNELNKQIGENIKNYRKRAGLKQYELAKKIGFNNITMSKIERGSDAIKISTIQKVADTLGYSFEQIVFGEDAIVLTNEIIKKIRE